MSAQYSDVRVWTNGYAIAFSCSKLLYISIIMAFYVGKSYYFFFLCYDLA